MSLKGSLLGLKSSQVQSGSGVLHPQKNINSVFAGDSKQNNQSVQNPAIKAKNIIISDLSDINESQNDKQESTPQGSVRFFKRQNSWVLTNQAPANAPVAANNPSQFEQFVYLPIYNLVADKYAPKQSGKSVHLLLNNEQKTDDKHFPLQLKQLEISKKLYIDEEFLPTDLSIGNSGNMREIVWKRLSEIYTSQVSIFPKEFSHEGLTTGQLDSDSLLSIFDFLITNPYLIKRVFQSTETNKQGIYSVWLFSFGEWRNFLLDDFVPIFNDTQEHAFINIKNQQQNLWIFLLEKSLAKMQGSYFQLRNKLFHEILQNITGSPYSYFPDLANSSQNSEQTWDILKEQLPLGHTISVYSNSQGNSNHILSNTTYLVSSIEEHNIDAGGTIKIIVLQKRNTQIQPIANLNLLGETLKNKINSSCQSNPGSFFMQYENFCLIFNRLGISKINSNYCQNSIMSNPVQFNNIQISLIRMMVPSDSKGNIELHQKEIQQNNINEQYSSICMLLACVQDNGQVDYISHLESSEKSIHIPFQLTKGTYCIIAFSQLQKKIDQINISVSSEKHIYLQNYKSIKVQPSTFLYLILKDLAEKKGVDIFPEGKYSKVYSIQSEKLLVYSIKNITNKFILKQTIEVENTGGCQLIDPSVADKNNTIEISLFPKEEIVIGLTAASSQDLRKVRLVFKQGDRLVMKENKTMKRDPKALQSQLQGTNPSIELNQLLDRKEELMKSLWNKYGNGQTDLNQEDEEDEEEQREEDEESKKEDLQVEIKQRSVKYQPTKIDKLFYKITVFLHLIILILIALASYQRLYYLDRLLLQ